MAIIDGLNDQRGMQTLMTQIANNSSEAQHSSDILYHTNGYFYCAVSESYSNAVLERRLYLYRSIDNGNTWTKVTNLTSGRFDNYPCLLQLDESSTSSDIGIVFLGSTSADASTGIIRRMSVDVSGTQVLPPDPLTGSPTASTRPSLVKSAAGYKVFISSASFTRSVTLYSNTSFSLNSWALDSTQNVLGVNNEGRLQRVRRLSNGDYLALFCARTALNGSTTNTNSLPDNVRTDVFAAVSTDEGGSWQTPQQITSYSGTAGNSKNGIDSALNVDAVQQVDGRIAMVFQEGKAHQVIDDNTTPAITLSGEFLGLRKTAYHPVHDYLLYGDDSDTTGGLFVHNLATNIVTRIYSGSTPSMWETEVQDIAVSSDGKYVVVATATQSGSPSGSLEVFDTTNANPALWTVTSLRTSTSPALTFTRIESVQFVGSTYVFVFTYANNTTTEFGGSIDASSPTTLTKFFSSGSAAVQRSVAVYEAGNKVYGVSGNAVFATNLTTGAALYNTAFGALSANPPYRKPVQRISSTGELVVFGDSVIIRVTDTGSAFSQVGSTLTTSTSPATFTMETWAQFANGVLMVSGANTLAVGAYTGQDNIFYPTLSTLMDMNFGFQYYRGETHFDEVTLSSKVWFIGNRLQSVNRCAHNTGRVRVGIFPYNTSTHQITTSGVDFYDAVNQIRVGTDWDRLVFPRIHRNASDRLFVSSTRLNLNRATQPKKVVVGVIESDAQRMTMRGTIRSTTTRTITMRARIRNTYRKTLDSKALIVFAQCIKLRARIVPRVTYTLQSKASIKGSKSISMTGTFNVQTTRQSRMTGRFFAATGYTGKHTLTMGARITKKRQARITGHFLVKMSNIANPVSYSVGFNTASLQSLRVGAGITR